ncbi:alpha/beta fold hydrolase [Nocardia jiangxiensis]|uniref:Alpha/beta fold hydrolase n=1 Tax=Nocardia jiangxiensis TaxID=282685 RepID=A0ABW6S5L0_9NOCA|nr:alpha/beta hydrolase [Nocardia jiangxiensis]
MTNTSDVVVGPAAPAVLGHSTGSQRGRAMTTTAPVVLLHGQPGDHSAWNGVLEQLPSSVRAMAWDRPGYGANERPAGTLEENAVWLLDRLERAGIHDAVLAGHSYGGGVALAAAAIAPERVRGLISIAGIGPDCATRWDEVLAAPVAGPALALAMWSMMPRLARWHRTRHPDAVASWHAFGDIQHEYGPVWRTVLLEQRELFRSLDHWLDRLDATDMPALIVADPTDKVVPISTARALHDRFPRSRLELVAGGGHLLPQRIPDVIAAKIGEFVDSVG